MVKCLMFSKVKYTLDNIGDGGEEGGIRNIWISGDRDRDGG